MEEIGKIDDSTLQLGNEGNKVKLAKFLDEIMSSGLKKEDIKSEIMGYFEAVDMGYR